MVRHVDAIGKTDESLIAITMADIPHLRAGAKKANVRRSRSSVSSHNRAVHVALNEVTLTAVSS